MHKHFEFHLGYSIVYGLYLLYRQLSRQHRAREAKLTKPRHLFRRAVIHLRRGVQERHAPHPAQCYATHGKCRHVLHEQCVDTDLGKLRDELLSGIKLIVIYNSIDGDVDLRAKEMGKVAQGMDVGNAVACRGTRAKVVGTDIHGIGTVADGGNAALKFLAGAKSSNVLMYANK